MSLMSFIFLSLVESIKELPSEVEIIGLASIVVPPTDPLEQNLLDHKNDMHLHERNKIDKNIFEQ